MVFFSLYTAAVECFVFFFSSRRRHTRCLSDWSSDVCSSDLDATDRLPLAFDGDADTRWLTGRPQNGDEWIRLTFDRARDVSAIALQTAARSFGDYPRELSIESVGDDGVRTVLFQVPMLV